MGLAAGTIDTDGYKYVVAIISLSLLATPLWLFLVDNRGVLKHLDVIRVVKTRIKPKKEKKNETSE